MFNYQQSSIWQRTLGEQPGADEHKSHRDFLRVAFENFRERAKLLSYEIHTKLPTYTVHSIEHIDALWDTAQLVVSQDYELNPAEAYVLGGAFLLHDLGMALAAYPRGMDELKQEPMWQDAAAAFRREKLTDPAYKDDAHKIESEAEEYATDKTLRLLHAKRASVLATISWKDASGSDLFLMDDSELRDSYGHIIGLIAYSHWWNIEELESKLPPSLGALSRFPSGWAIDSLKLACILRVADAMQIDDRRAPSFLRAIRQLPKAADLHWLFQNRLLKPQLRPKENRIAYTSKSPFTVDEMESWWVCFDTLKMIDNELRQVDALLSSKGKQTLAAFGVSSVEEPGRLSRLVTVDGWQPIDVKIKVNNVARLVNTIGGEQLYGKNMIVPLRELIQNASDAVRARRVVEGEPPEYGDVIVTIGSDANGKYIEVEDNGIGMSQAVLTGPFLDFGQSFWGTDLMHEELPGLEAKGFASTGKYGIGFFSLFMWGDRIRVTTNRYDKGRADTLVLEFNGAASRPVLRKAGDSEVIRSGGTRVRVWVDDKILSDLLDYDGERGDVKCSYADSIEDLYPSIDCNIYVVEKGKSKKVITANDWMTMPPKKFVARLLNKAWQNVYVTNDKDFDEICKLAIKNMEIIKNREGVIIGRAALIPSRIPRGHVTVGGFKTSDMQGIFGILTGASERASRDIGIPIIEKPDLHKWIGNQVKKVLAMNVCNQWQIKISSCVIAMKGNTGGLKIANHGERYVSFYEIKELVSDGMHNAYILVQDAAIGIYERDNSCKISLNHNVLYVGVGTHVIHMSYMYLDTYWPGDEESLIFEDRTLKGLVIEALAEAWNCDIEAVYKSSDITADGRKYSACIGTAGGKEVIMDRVSIIRRPKKGK